MGGIELKMPISHPEGDVKSAGEYMTLELRMETGEGFSQRPLGAECWKPEER